MNDRRQEDRRDSDHAQEIKEKASVVAEELVNHAKEIARQLILENNLDISQIPRICDDIAQIKIVAEEAKNIAKASAETAYHDSVERIRMNRELTASVEELKKTLGPIAEIYTDLNGTKKVLKWSFYVVTLLIGFLISIRSLLK